MKIASYSIIVFLVFIAQTTAFHLYGNAPYPDLAILLAIYGGIRWGKFGGTQFGASVGLIQDFLSYGAVGTNMFSYGVIGFAVGKLYEKFINDSIVTRVMLVLAATVFDKISFGVLSYVFLSHDLSLYLGKSVLPQALVNIVFSFLFLPLLAMADRYTGNLGAQLEGKSGFRNS